MSRLNRIVLLTLSFALIGGVAATALAQDDAPDRKPHAKLFKLSSTAHLVAPDPDDPTGAEPLDVRFTGEGRAVVNRRHVVLRLGVLDARGQRGVAVIHVRNPLDRQNSPDGATFSGHGKAVVRVAGETYRFGLNIDGRIERSSAGEAVMRGRFHQLNADRPAEFRGGFRGKAVHRNGGGGDDGGGEG